MTPAPARELHLEAVHCSIGIHSYPCGVILLKISGTDVGEFGSRPMLAIKECLTDNEPVQLFIDAAVSAALS